MAGKYDNGQKIALWAGREGSKLAAKGQLTLSLDFLESLLASMERDEKTEVRLEVVLFHNERRSSERSPDITGKVQIPEAK